jgi:tetratricopeptide (TPR) repeat protein
LRYVLAFTFEFLVLLFAGCRSNPQPFVDAGNKLFASGHYEDAALRYRKALQKNPLYGEAYYRLGLAELELGNGSQALGALVEAASLLPGREDVNGKLADVLLFSYLKNPETGKQVYQKLTELSSHLQAETPNSYNGWRIKGYIAFLDKRPEEAASALMKANQARPYDPELVASLCQALFQTSRNQEGERLALDLLSHKKDASAVYDILYRYYVATGKLRDAEALIKTKCANNPKEPQYVIELALHYLRTGQSQQVSATLQSLVSKQAEFPNARLYVGDFYAQSRNWERAIQTYRDGADAEPKQKNLYNKRIVTLLLQLGKLDAARPLIDTILRDSPKDPEARAYRARLLLESGKPADLEASIKEFKGLLEENQRDENLHYDLGRAYHAQGKLDEAWTQFQQAARLRSDFVPALLALSEISHQKDNPDQTLRYAADVLWFAPKDREARFLRCLGMIGTGQPAEAELGLRALLKDYPQDRNARLQLALLDIWDKKYNEADILFKSVYQPGSSDIAGLEGRVENYAAQNHIEKAVQMLRSEAELPVAPKPVHQLLAKTAVRAGMFAVAIAEYRRLATADPNSIQLQVQLGETYADAGDFPNALPVLRKARESAPTDPAPIRALAAALIRADMKEDAIAACRRLLAIAPDDLDGLNNLAFLLAESGNHSTEAVALAQKARLKAPDDATVTDTLGWAFFKQGDCDSAIQVFNMLVQKYPDRAVYHYHFGAALLQKGRKDEARGELQTALQKHPSKADEDKIKGLLAIVRGG